MLPLKTPTIISSRATYKYTPEHTAELLSPGCRYSMTVFYQCFKQALWAAYTQHLFKANRKNLVRKREEEKKINEIKKLNS